MKRTFHFSVQGASHIKRNKECQDASDSCEDPCCIAVVCDGHGGDDYVRSAVGSSMACVAAIDNLKHFAADINIEEFDRNTTSYIKSLEASIINDWNEAIYAHFASNPFTEEELSQVSPKARKAYEESRVESAYGTTLLAMLQTNEYWLGIQIGDGKCVVIQQDGIFTQPIPWDDKCFLNATTSICDSAALDHFRHYYTKDLPNASFVGTDGIDDCFRNDEQLYQLYQTIVYSFATTTFEEALFDLNDYLPRLSAKGSGDDVSIAAILDLKQIGTLDMVTQFHKEETAIVGDCLPQEAIEA